MYMRTTIRKNRRINFKTLRKIKRSKKFGKSNKATKYTKPNKSNKSKKNKTKKRLYFKGGDDEEKDICSFCLDPLDDGKELYTTSCNHTFHKDCIINICKNTWENNRINNRRTPCKCPICRKDINTEIATLSDHPQEELEDEPNESEDEIDLNTYEADPQRQSVFREFNRILDAGLNREIPPLPEDLIEEMDEMPDIVPGGTRDRFKNMLIVVGIWFGILDNPGFFSIINRINENEDYSDEELRDILFDYLYYGYNI